MANDILIGTINYGNRGPKGADGAIQYTAGDNIVISEDNVISAIGGAHKPYTSLRRLDNYLYEITFDTVPEYIPLDINSYGCSSYVKDGKLFRNLDFNYSNMADFKVILKNAEGMAFIDGLNDGETEENAELLGQLAYHIVDGRNNAGLMVSEHILNNDFDFSGTGDKNLSCSLLPYYILTTMTDVNVVSDEVTNVLNNIKVSDILVQVLVTDGTTTKLFTPTENGYEYIDISDNPKLTNFK